MFNQSEPQRVAIIRIAIIAVFVIVALFVLVSLSKNAKADRLNHISRYSKKLVVATVTVSIIAEQAGKQAGNLREYLNWMEEGKTRSEALKEDLDSAAPDGFNNTTHYADEFLTESQRFFEGSESSVLHRSSNELIIAKAHEKRSLGFAKQMFASFRSEVLGSSLTKGEKVRILAHMSRP